MFACAICYGLRGVPGRSRRPGRAGGMGGEGNMFDGFLSLPVLAVAAFFGVSYFVNPGTIIIQDISVPHALEDSGFTHEVAAATFTEQLSEIADSAGTNRGNMTTEQNGRASCRERVCKYV